MIPFIAPLLGVIGSLGKSWLETRKVKAEGSIKITQAKIDAKIARVAAKSHMDLAAQTGMQYSWKDEYLVILLTAPVILCFIPGLEQYALNGFKILESTPEWYRWALTGMIAATFGIRTWAGFKK